ncbi:MAG: hypothetical protein H6832_14390 [Planctomycetes bacterium]|nr:hypothetical protein [Planctomycetota bacterium]MCB9919588.1 hypothetical protein [Planctomycetota bacterium]
MTDTTAPTPTKKPKKDPDRVIIRPWPKVIFLYPTLVASLIGWFASWLSKDGASAAGNPTVGWIFMLIFAINLLVFAFDFSRIKSITILFIGVAIVFALMWANNQWEIMAWVREKLGTIDIRMNAQFYGFMAFLLAFIFFLVFVNTRFNYYEINRNEILHHHGYLGDIRRTPTTAMRMQKEIYDLMEYALLRSGRLVFNPQTEREALVIDNVVGINEVERRIKYLLSSVSVAVRQEDVSEEAF